MSTGTHIEGFEAPIHRHLGAIDIPTPVNPSRPQCQTSENQLSLTYA